MELFFNEKTMFRHIGENILKNLDQRSMIACKITCKTWKSFVENSSNKSRFWLDSSVLQAETVSNKIYSQWDVLINETSETEHKETIKILLKEMQNILSTKQWTGYKTRCEYLS